MAAATDPTDPVRDLFLAALGRPEGEWSAFVAASAAPAEVRERVRALLADHAGARGAGFLAAPAALPIPAPGPAPGPSRGDLPRWLGAYEVVGLLGSGGMGVVYRAFDHDLQRFVAIKALPAPARGDAAAALRWVRERRAHGRLEHPNLVRAYCTLGDGPERFLVLEHVDGLALHDLIARCGPLPVAEACEAVRQAALGLDCAHGVGVVHRDVKPANLMLDRSGVVKVLDLGVALLHRADRPATRLTAEHQAPGSLDFMAPEQLLAPAAVDGRADVHGLGATLYYLLTARPPRGAHPSALHALRALDVGESVPVRALRPDVPEPLGELVGSCLSRDPAARPATPAALAAALSSWAEGGAAPLRLRAEAHAPAAPPPPPDPGAGPADGRDGRGRSNRVRVRTGLTHLLPVGVPLVGLGGLLAVALSRGRMMGTDTPALIKPWLEIVYLTFEVLCLGGGILLALARRNLLHRFALLLALVGLGGLAGYAVLRRQPELATRAARLLDRARGVDPEAKAARDGPLVAERLRAALERMEGALGRVAPAKARRVRFVLAGPLVAGGRPALAAFGLTAGAGDGPAGVVPIDLDALGLTPADWDRLLDGYPYGVRDEGWEARRDGRGGRDVLPHVRADWLLASGRGLGRLRPPRSGADLERARQAYARDLDWEGVAAELWLDPAVDGAALRARLARSGLARRPEVAGLIARGRIRRDDWARVYQDVFQALGLGTPVTKFAAG